MIFRRGLNECVANSLYLYYHLFLREGLLLGQKSKTEVLVRAGVIKKYGNGA
jgi:hypothetical protein